MLIIEDLPEELPGLSEIVIGVGWLEPANHSLHLVLADLGLRHGLVGLEAVGLVVGLGALVTINSHGSISLAMSGRLSCFGHQLVCC